MKKALLLGVILFTASLAQSQIDSGLLAKYYFNNQSTADESSNQNDGVGFNLTLATDRFGNSNYCYSFNGDSSRIDLPDSLLARQELSISMWFKTSTGGALIGLQNTTLDQTANQWVPIFYVREDSTLNATMWTGNVTNLNDSTTHLNDDAWHHVVISGDSSSQNVYIDNVLTGTGPGILVLTNMIKNQIGTAVTRGSWSSAPIGPSEFPFDGSIDDVRIYNRTLSVGEVDTLFNESNPVVSTGIQETAADESVIISPNPANQVINIQTDISIHRIELIDMYGRIVREYTNVANQINVGGLDKGFYFLRLSDKEGTVLASKKILKQ
ncbi:MAG: T9SS type A sorting domain-containing protein [Saprospiraceae bacterium]|nr:T9SS type A sorting domain-containing protein [Saprospiraceae bacterium]